MSDTLGAEHYVLTRVKANHNLLIPYYLMLCFLYYKHDISMVSDAFFDRLCKALELRYSILEHCHKRLVDPEALRAGTGFNIIFYPMIVQNAAVQLAKELGFEFHKPSKLTLYHLTQEDPSAWAYR